MLRFKHCLAPCLLALMPIVAVAQEESASRLPAPDVEGLEAAQRDLVTALHGAVTTLFELSTVASQRAEAVGELGRYYHSLGRAAAAETCYQMARDEQPRDYRWPYYTGVLLESEGRLEAAAAAYEAALTMGEAVAPLMRLARVYAALGRPEAARRNALQAAGIVPDVTDSTFDDPLVEGLVERAEERAHLLLGRVAFHEGRFEEAAAAFERALAENPDGIAGLVNLGLSLAALGRHDEAVAQFQRGAEVAPVDPAPRLQLGLLLLELGDLDGARGHLEAAAALGPENPAAHAGLGEILRQSGDPETALVHYRRAISLDPNQERPRLGEAHALQMLGRHVEMRAQLEDAHRLFPNSGLVSYGLAWALATSPDAAQRDPERALELARDVFSTRGAVQDAVLVAAALAAADRCLEAASFLGELAEAAGEEAGGEAAASYLQARIRHFERGSPCVLPPSGQVE